MQNNSNYTKLFLIYFIVQQWVQNLRNQKLCFNNSNKRIQFWLNKQKRHFNRRYRNKTHEQTRNTTTQIKMKTINFSISTGKLTSLYFDCHGGVGNFQVSIWFLLFKCAVNVPRFPGEMESSVKRWKWKREGKNNDWLKEKLKIDLYTVMMVNVTTIAKQTISFYSKRFLLHT